MTKGKNSVNSETFPEKKITLSIQHIISYSIFLVTFGASVYTFFSAIPKIDTLNDEVKDINTSIAVFQERINNIKERFSDIRTNENKTDSSFLK